MSGVEEQPPSNDGRNWWSSRSRRAKILIVVAAAVVIFGVIGALSEPTEETDEVVATTTASNGNASTTTAGSDVSPETTEEEEEEEPEPEPEPEPPPPIVLEGSGAQVETINISRDSPAIATISHRGSSNFVVELVGADGSELLVNEIGNYSGRVAVAEVSAARYRVAVTADGPWTIEFTQPVPTPDARQVPGVMEGRGSDVIRFRTAEEMQPIIEATHTGSSNFVVYIIGYGDTSGQELLFNEIGNFRGETIVNNLPEGSYLLAVTADGPWTIRVTP